MDWRERLEGLSDPEDKLLGDLPPIVLKPKRTEPKRAEEGAEVPRAASAVPRFEPRYEPPPLPPKWEANPPENNLAMALLAIGLVGAVIGGVYLFPKLTKGTVQPSVQATPSGTTTYYPPTQKTENDPQPPVPNPAVEQFTSPQPALVPGVKVDGTIIATQGVDASYVMQGGQTYLIDTGKMLMTVRYGRLRISADGNFEACSVDNKAFLTADSLFPAQGRAYFFACDNTAFDITKNFNKAHAARVRDLMGSAMARLSVTRPENENSGGVIPLPVTEKMQSFVLKDDAVYSYPMPESGWQYGVKIARGYIQTSFVRDAPPCNKIDPQYTVMAVRDISITPFFRACENAILEATLQSNE